MQGVKRSKIKYTDQRSGCAVNDWRFTCQRCGKVHVENFPVEFRRDHVLAIMWCWGWYYTPNTGCDLHCPECDGKERAL